MTTQPMLPADTATEPLLLDRDGPVATLTINRPDRLNALTFAMFSRLPALLAEAAAMDGVRVLVLRGAGRKSFSAGRGHLRVRDRAHDTAAGRRLR